MEDIFYDTTYSLEIRQKGFVRKDILNSEDLKALKDLYASLGPPDRKGTHVTMFDPSYEYRCKVDQGIKAICQSKVQTLMKGYKALYANFMVKESGQEGDFPLHQDWTYVDEHFHTSVAVWIPLDDVNERNGALHVVERSHKFITQLRGPYVHEPFQAIGEYIKTGYSSSADLKAGEALMWDHRLIHFSKPNLTEKPRIAVTLIMVPSDAEVIHCFAAPESQGRRIEKYKVDTDFYMRYVISQRPKDVSLVEIVEQPAINFTKEEFDAIYVKENSVE